MIQEQSCLNTLLSDYMNFLLSAIFRREIHFLTVLQILLHCGLLSVFFPLLLINLSLLLKLQQESVAVPSLTLCHSNCTDGQDH